MEHVALVELHTGLVKGVHTKNVSGHSTGQLQEEEQLAHLPVVQLAAVHGNDGNAAVHVGRQRAEEGLLIHEVHGLALQIVQPIQILVIGTDGILLGRRVKANHGLKNVPGALLDHLTKRMEIRGKLGSHGEQALAVLALGLTEQLLPPTAKHLEARLEALKQLDCLSVAVQQVPHGGVLPHGVFEGAQIIAFPGIHGAVQHGFHIHTGNRQRQQTYSGQHGEPSAHIGRNHKGLPALFRSHLPQRTLAGVGNGIDPTAGTVGSVLPLQHPAQRTGSNGGLGSGSRLGDDGDGNVLALQQTAQVIPVPGAQAVAHEENLGLALTLQQIIVCALQQLNGCPGAQIAAADTHDHKHVGVGTDLPRGRLDPADLLTGSPGGQLLPSQEIVSLAGAVHQSGMGRGNFLFHSQQVGQCDLSPDIGNINFNHWK